MKLVLIKETSGRTVTLKLYSQSSARVESAKHNDIEINLI